MDNVWKALTLVVALGLACIAFQQFRLGREKFKLDLFEKRFSIFVGTRRFLSIMLSDATVTRAQIVEYQAAVAEAPFLFDADITQYLDEIEKKAIRSLVTRTELDQRPPVENRQQIVEENVELLNWLSKQLPNLKHKFTPYLKFHIWS